MRTLVLALGIFPVLFLTACGGQTSQTAGDAGLMCSETPYDDPALWEVDTTASYDITVSEPSWVVPSDTLPKNLKLQASNNNVDIALHCGRLYMAWRNSATHFASDSTHMFIVSSGDMGKTWDYETQIFLKTDVREPRFLSFKGRLQLMFFEAGTNPFQFEPIRMSRALKNPDGKWSKAQVVVEAPEVPWDVKVRGGRAWLTSYMGQHYDMDDPNAAVKVFLSVSDDGDSWSRVDGADRVYIGGVSEGAFEFDADGSLWAELRNEDGDATGFGSLLCSAKPGSLSSWSCPSKSDPERYDSAKMFRHGSEIFILGRRDIGGPYDEGETTLSFEEQKKKYLFDYSARPKGFALYRVDKANSSVSKVMDLPGAADTAFPAVRRTGPHSFLVANYTSPLWMKDLSWLAGQTSEEGTQIYLMEINFVRK